MVADGEMSFTHARPDNFAEYTSWASSGCSSCNATFGEADGFYSWSRGPDITMGGYSYSGLDSMEIEQVSLVLHISIPDALPSDEVNVIMQNHGSDILVTTFARTLGPLNRMINPLVVNLDSHLDWDWPKLEQTQFNVDYVSDNQGADDSEVRVDAVGLRVKYHQPWFSFENARAEHSSIPEKCQFSTLVPTMEKYQDLNIARVASSLVERRVEFGNSGFSTIRPENRKSACFWSRESQHLVLS